ncbi:MAG: hypothetical protein IPG57_01535 [Burkholderiales bacterium]|jgi:hypothetical protein|nr:hypothetical protein [Burkholderiales bacterium]
MKTLEALKAELLDDPGTRAEFEALAPEFNWRRPELPKSSYIRRYIDWRRQEKSPGLPGFLCFAK